MTTARIIGRTKLFYAGGADASQGRPAHVRAGSGVVVVGDKLVIIQDDANFFAVVDKKTKRTTSIALPPGPGGIRTFDEASGTKKHKMDLECVTVVDGAVVAFGSGSTDQRERIVVARVGDAAPSGTDGAGASVRVVDASALYAALRAHPLMKGKELNIEGVCVHGGRVTFFQRGNGEGALNATFDVDASAFRGALNTALASTSTATLGALAIVGAKRWDLGAVKDAAPEGGDVGLTFTDACAHDGRIFVLAAAEASPNAVDDGVVVGCAFGVLGQALTPILDERGGVYVGKPEGIAVDGAGHGWLVVDKDDATAPCELLEISFTEK